MATLKVFYDEIQQLMREFSNIFFVHIPRQDNYRADALVNRALDELPAPSMRTRTGAQQTPFAEKQRSNTRPMRSRYPGK